MDFLQTLTTEQMQRLRVAAAVVEQLDTMGNLIAMRILAEAIVRHTKGELREGDHHVEDLILDALQRSLRQYQEENVCKNDGTLAQTQ